MHKWYAALLDNDVPSITVEEGEIDDDVIKRLDNAEKTEIFDDKRVIGFWITDPASEQLDVLRIWGVSQLTYSCASKHESKLNPANRHPPPPKPAPAAAAP